VQIDRVELVYLQLFPAEVVTWTVSSFEALPLVLWDDSEGRGVFWFPGPCGKTPVSGVTMTLRSSLCGLRVSS
jgi:hypothetical protein